MAKIKTKTFASKITLETYQKILMLKAIFAGSKAEIIKTEDVIEDAFKIAYEELEKKYKG